LSTCKNCTRSYKCEIIAEIIRTSKELKRSKQMTLDMSFEERREKRKELRKKLMALKRKRLKCLNKRLYLHNKLGYNLFI